MAFKLFSLLLRRPASSPSESPGAQWLSIAVSSWQRNVGATVLTISWSPEFHWQLTVAYPAGRQKVYDRRRFSEVVSLGDHLARELQHDLDRAYKLDHQALQA